jgi:CheY-like chemotaxis protein
VGPRLFRDIFFSTKPRHRGLGLLVVYGTLYRFGGGLKRDATAAPGARWRLYVPIADVAGSALTAHDGQPRVLLVHANEPIFEGMRKILEARGCAVESTAAFDAFTLPGRTFTLIVIETTLPQMNGFHLARRILEHDPKANILFAHTQGSFLGSTEEDLLKRFDLMRWPLEPPTLLEAVQVALKRTTE